MKSIKAIVFDLGGVLIDLDINACIKAFTDLGYKDAHNLIDPYKQHGTFLKLEEGLIEPQEFYDSINEKISIHLSNEEIKVALQAFLLDIPDYKLNMLTKLRSQGYQIFMLSNTNVVMFEYMCSTRFTKQGLTVDDYFDKLYLSYQMKCVKPYPIIFEKMASDSGIAPEDMLFIDDSKANIETAKALGFEAYLAAPQEDYRCIFKEYELKK